MLLLFSFQLWKYKTDGPIFSSPAIWNWFHEPSESISKYKQVPPGLSSKNIVCSLVDPDVSDSCDKHHKSSRLKKEDNIEDELSKDINDENTIISHNCTENIIFGSHDHSVNCVTNLGKLVWKIDAESPVYSTPFSGLATIRGKCNDHPITNCLEKDKLAETSGDEPNIMVDQNSIVESDERGIIKGEKCLKSIVHSECIMVDGAENIVNKSSMVHDQNHENDSEEINEGDKYQNTNVKSEVDNENQTVDVSNEAVDSKNQIIGVKTEDVYKEYLTIDINSKEVYNEDQKTDVETYFVDDVHLNSFQTNEDKDNKHQKSDIKTEDVENEYLNVDVKSDSVDQNISVKQNSGDQNISAKSNTTDGSNVSNSDTEKTQSVAIVTFATTTGILYVVGAEDGQVLYKTQMEGEVFSSPILYRNSLVVGCRDDNVYCFDIDAG